MNAEQWAKVQRVFAEAVELPKEAQRARLRSLCEQEPTVGAEVEALLEADGSSDDLLQSAQRLLARATAELQAANEARDLAGTMVGDYRLIKKLGAGGMGVVYLAERSYAGGLVAIKLLANQLVAARFVKEQQLHAPLVHPAIAQFHGSGQLADGTPYFVLEYVDGTPLTAYCAQHALGLVPRLRLFRAVCEGVQFAHGRGVIHCDLKPANILAKADASVRLLDFGIARRLEGLLPSAQYTQGEPRMFTPAYAAPEQHRGEAVDVSTDVYALGVVLYELLALQHPFASLLEPASVDDAPAQLRAELTRSVCESGPLPLAAVAKKSGAGALFATSGKAAWADLERLVGKAMARDPNERYRTVESLIRDLDHFVRGEPLEARPGALGYRLGKFVRRHRNGLAFGLATVIALASTSAFYLIGLRRARDDAAAEAARAARVQQFMTALMTGGEDEVGPQHGLLVETMLERAVTQAPSLGHDRALRAELDATVGGLYTALGKFDRAAGLLSHALATDKQVLGWNSRQVGRDLLALSRLHFEQSQYPRAEREARQAFAVGKQLQPDDTGLVAKAVTLLGHILNQQGRYTDSVRELEATRAALSEQVTLEDLSDLLNALANAHFYLGHYAESERLNQRCLALDRKRLGEKHPDIGDGLINLAAVAAAQGHDRQAEQLDRQALTIIDGWYGASHAETASALTIWARALNTLQRYDEAQNALQRALAIIERVYPDPHPRLASVLNELGVVTRLRGRLEQADAYATRTLQIERALYKDDHYLVGVALANLGSVRLEQKRYPEAEALFRQTLENYARTLSKEHINYAVTRIKLGHCLLLEQRFTDARAQSQAGRAGVLAQASPPAKWLTSALRDLIAESNALGEPAAAASYAELLKRSASQERRQ